MPAETRVVFGTSLRWKVVLARELNIDVFEAVVSNLEIQFFRSTLYRMHLAPHIDGKLMDSCSTQHSASEWHPIDFKVYPPIRAAL